MTTPDSTPESGIDESYQYANPAAARAAGVDVAGMYLSHTPAKNANPAKIVGYHQVGIGFLPLWETTANRALDGAAAGAADGAEAASQLDALIRAVGYAPRNKVAIAFAVDFDTNSGDYSAIDAYLNAAKHAIAGRYLVGVYGEADLLDHTASHGVSQMEFGTYAWSYGRISSYDDFHQYLNGQQLGGAEVDLDKILHPVQLAAWWPPTSPYNVPNYDPSPWEDNVAISDEGIKQIVAALSPVLDKKLYDRGVADRDELIALARAIVNGVASGEFNEKNMANVVGEGGLAGQLRQVLAELQKIEAKVSA